MRSLKTRYQKLDHVAFHPSGGVLAGGDKQVAYWPQPTVDAATVPVAGYGSGWAAFVGDSSHIAYRDLSAGLHLLRLVDGERTPLPLPSERGGRLAPLGEKVLLHFGYFLEQRAFVLTPAGGLRLLWTSPAPLYTSAPLRLGDDRFAQILLGSQLLIRAVDTGEQLASLPFDTHLSIFTPWTVSPDDRLMACASTNHLRVYDLTTSDLRAVQRIDNGDGHFFTSLAFHPSGRFLAATSNDETVKLYDTTNWALATTFTWAIGRMRSVAFSEDGLLAAAGSDSGRVVVWDVDV